jgi:hypothetical protein
LPNLNFSFANIYYDLFLSPYLLFPLAQLDMYFGITSPFCSQYATCEHLVRTGKLGGSHTPARALHRP